MLRKIRGRRRGESILEALAEKLEKNPGKGDLTDDAIKQHKLYQELELAAQKRRRRRITRR